jgi:hypothetical protein
MKKILLISVVTVMSFTQLKAQQPIKEISKVKPTITSTEDLKLKNSCCTANPFTLTACSQSLLQSFKNLAAGVGDSLCSFPTVSFAMPQNCYSMQANTPGIVTYSSYYDPKATPSIFRVIWGSTPGSYAYYGACAPSPIIYPNPGLTENHVFEAKLIKQSDYKAFTGLVKDWNTMAAVASVPVSDIKQITAVYMEENGGYISNTEAANYNDVLSSKGIVVKATLKNGSNIICYLINNYDKGGTINWKENNPTCTK